MRRNTIGARCSFAGCGDHFVWWPSVLRHGTTLLGWLATSPLGPYSTSHQGRVGAMGDWRQMGSHVWTYWLIHLYGGSPCSVVPGSVLGTAGQLHSFPDYHLTRLRRLGAVSATALGSQHCCAADGKAQIANSVFSPMYGSSYVRTLQHACVHGRRSYAK